MSVKIIGISGISGSGKTTLAKALALKLKATSLFWDEFDEVSTSPDDLILWHKDGRNDKAWDYAAIVSTIRSLKKGKSLKHPVLKHELHPTQYLVFDAPLGRFHKQTGDYIDFCIHLDTPLDVALSRRLLRDYAAAQQDNSELIEELRFYLDHSRELYFDDHLKQGADLIVDGLLPINEQVKYINSHLPR